MKILRNEKYPHLRLEIDGEAQTLVETCENCGHENEFQGKEAAYRAAVGGGHSFRLFHRNCENPTSAQTTD